MKKISLGVLITLLLAAGVYFGLLKPSPASSSPGNNGKTGSPQPPTTAMVENRDIQFSVTVAGEIGPAEQVSVRPEVNGRIARLPVDVGDEVEKGDLLFTLDDKDIQIEIASNETELNSAKLRLQQAERDFERDRHLFEESLVSREVFENTKTEYDLAKNEIQRAERAIELARDRLSKTRIEAPFDCTILTRPVSVGQAVSGSGGFNSGTEVLTIANLNDLIINAHVNQADVSRLHSGLHVDIEVEAIPGLVVKGVVERIAPQATIVNNIKGFSTRIRITEGDPRIQPGMTANITIPVESADNVVSVPLAGVFTEYNQEAGRTERYVYLLRDGRFYKQLVDIGVSDYFNVEILKGLEPGQVISLVPPPPEKVVTLPPEKQSTMTPSSSSAART